jgi:NAD(P)-dependent dehydrogenase (short-subunit alcohol dehydrogenase family)
MIVPTEPIVFPSPTKTFRKDQYDAIQPTRPELSAAGKGVLITGGGQGIGAAIAEAFAKAGAREVIITGRTARTLSATKSQIDAAYPKTSFRYFVASVSDATAIKNVFESINRPIDILVANAGYLPTTAKVTNMDIDDFWEAYETNVKGSVILAQLFAKYSSKTDPVFVSVNTGIAHFPGGGFGGEVVGYASSKIALAKVMEYLSAEEPHMRVYSLQPGVVHTAMNDKHGVVVGDDSKYPFPK